MRKKPLRHIKPVILLTLFCLPALVSATESEWQNLLPAQTDQLDVAWQDFSDQGGPSDKPLAKIRTGTWHIFPSGRVHHP